MRYRIGSFNMKNWGKNPLRDFERIADIIVGEKLDVVAFQEILSEGAGVKKLLELGVKYQLYNWDFCWDLPHETTDITKIADIKRGDRRGEGYAFIWNKNKFKLAEYQKLGESKNFEPRIINAQSRDVQMNGFSFARAPYYIRLYPCYGGFFDLRLINIHIYFGSSLLSDIQKRKQEYEILTQMVYPQISERRYGDFRPAYTIAMGDYNLNIIPEHLSKIYALDLSQMPKISSGYEIVHGFDDKNAVVNNETLVWDYGKVITCQDKLTTLKKPKDDFSSGNNALITGYANSYDHFTYSPEQSCFSEVSFQAINAVEKYCGGDFVYYLNNISDHLPIVMEFEL